MRKLPAIAFAAATAAGLAGTAVAASGNNHVMSISLPDGSTAHIEYTGAVAPKVTIMPSAPVAVGDWALPAFAGFDRMFAEMNREAEAMMHQAQQAATQPQRAGASPYFAAFGNAPGSVSSTTIVSYSNGSGTCTRTTEAISQGPGKPPKVTSSVRGDCGAPSPAGEDRAAPKLDHT